MTLSRSLRGRVILALLAMIAVTNIGFATAVFFETQKLEATLLDAMAMAELSDFLSNLQGDPKTPLPRSANVQIYLYSRAEQIPIPESFSAYPPGIYHDVAHYDWRYHLLVRDLSDDRVYVATNISYVDEVEKELAMLLVLGSFFVILVAVTFAFWLSRRIVAPVSALAREVGKLDPVQRNVRLSAQYRTYEVGVIAQAFDQYLERMDGFVEREQSFTSAASHELRNPVMVISSSAELLARDAELSPRSRVLVERIHRASRQISDIIVTLLALAREHVPGRDEESGETRLPELVHQLVEDYRHLLKEKPVTLKVNASADATVHAPGAHVSIVVGNLLRNAFIYTDSGSITIDIRKDSVVISDTGPGMEQMDPSEMFTRRYSDGRRGGLGLGLYLTKQICDRNGWTLTLDSTPGEGTVATVSF